MYTVSNHISLRITTELDVVTSTDDTKNPAYDPTITTPDEGKHTLFPSAKLMAGDFYTCILFTHLYIHVCEDFEHPVYSSVNKAKKVSAKHTNDAGDDTLNSSEYGKLNTIGEKG